MKPPTDRISTNVCIIGGGFAGMNLARLLAEKGIPCQICTSGTGASQLWMGTVDILNYPGDNLELELAKFQVSIPSHPYGRLSIDLIETAMKDLFNAFPLLQQFEENGHLVNRAVLSSLGNLKLCTGIWNSIFYDFQRFTATSICVLIEFEEFPSSMWTIRKSLQEKYPGQFVVINFSLTELFKQTDPQLAEKATLQKLNIFEIAQFFDQKAILMSPMASQIKQQLTEQYPSIKYEDISLFLFPPLLGIDFTPTIISHLNTYLGKDVFEIVALSPSVIAQRFFRKFERKLDVLAVPLYKKCTLEGIHRGDKYWICDFQLEQNESKQIKAPYVVIAAGSLFTSGILADSARCANVFHELGLEYPDSVGPNFEVLCTSAHSNIFIIGSSLFLFSSQLGDDDEVIDGTGLGVAISTSYQVAQTLIRLINKTESPSDQLTTK